MKKIFKWIGIVLLALFVLGLLASGDKAPGTSTPAAANAPEAKKEVVKISAVELFQSYDANEVATDERLKGKIVEVSGTIQAIDKDAFNNIVIRLRTPNEFMSAAMQVGDSDKAKAIALRKGDKVAIRCARMSRMIGSPYGADCVL